MRRYVVLFCLLLATTLTAYEQQVKEISAQLTPRLVAANRHLVAVVDFTDLQGNTTELGRFLAEELSVAMSLDAKGFSVVDRTHLKALLQENKLATTGVIDPQTARQLGKIAGVDALVTGTLTPFGDSVRLSVKVLDAQTATTLAAATSEVPKTKAIEELLARSVSAPSPASAMPGATGIASAATLLNSRTYRNDFLSVTVDSVGILKSARDLNASVTLVLENTGKEDEYLAYIEGTVALADTQGRVWRVPNTSDISGLTRAFENNSLSKSSVTRLAPASKQTLIVRFASDSSVELPAPTSVSFTITCFRLRGTSQERFSIGIPRIPVGQ